MASSSPASAVVVPVALLQAMDAALRANYPGPTAAAAWDAVKACAAAQGEAPYPAANEDLRYLWCAAGGIFVTTPSPSGKAAHNGVMPANLLYAYLRTVYQKTAYWRELAERTTP